MEYSPQDLLESLLAAETAVWEALVSGDAAADAGALDDGFLGVYPDGFSGKGTHVGQLAQGATVKTYAIDDPHVMSLGPDHALLAYRATYRRPGQTADEVMYVSSVWKRNRQGWINVFSQDTPAADDWTGP
ncbi:MAG: nuclear transport factor 2 family protein [Alphaproteobacteria bacterium]|nr:nuclear transport factor 2 family protein [Alphaproteobacteria bacterium]